MKVLINASCPANLKSSLWGNYVIQGTKNKPRNQSKIEVIAGNTKLGDSISGSGKWKTNEFTLVLAFKGKQSKEVMKLAYIDFIKDFTHGFERREYHVDAVCHYDTDNNWHIHVRIPKLNLVTGTALRLYMDSQDRNRINLIRDTICKRYDLDISIDEKPLVKESSELAKIEKWRSEESREPFKFKTKKDRAETESIVSNAVIEYHEAGYINNIDDLKDFIQDEIGLKVLKDNGHDYAKDMYYFTVMDEDSGKKITLKGDLFSHEFWNNKREIREDKIRNNKSNQRESNRDKRSLRELEYELEKVNRKRKREVEKSYRTSRKRARQKLQKDFYIPQYNHDSSRNNAPFSVNYSDSYMVAEALDKSGDTETLADSIQRGRRVLADSLKRNRDTRYMDLHQKRKKVNDNSGTEVKEYRRGEYEAHTTTKERENQLFETLRVTRSQLSESLRKAEQQVLENIKKSRNVMEKNIRSDAERIDEKIISSNSKLREYTSKIHELLGRVGNRVAKLKKSIVGVADEIKKIRLFKQARQQAKSQMRSKKIKLSPRR
ncbi:MAG: hypothetical protein GQ531_04905 [Sulfurovum sp.]|nr:hypothetical protein [Sulfurovum sp.]